MYYSSGNYEAFARPEKPEGVDHKSAYLIGSGLAALSAACFMVRDGQMKGEHIHVLEKDPIPGGACDGYKYQDIGYVMRGGREMDNHFECMWDLFRSIPSIEDENVTVLDEYYWLNKHDPNYSQKLVFRTSSSKKSVIFLSYNCSSGVMNSFKISMAPLSDRPNLPSVWASSPQLTVARHRL